MSSQIHDSTVTYFVIPITFACLILRYTMLSFHCILTLSLPLTITFTEMYQIY